MNDFFSKFSRGASHILGASWSFILAILLIVIWLITGPIFNFSDTWQLIINTTTTIITFLMVFLIQNTQNRDARAMHLKLDEIIHGLKHARNSFVDLENATDEELEAFDEEFHKLKAKYRDRLNKKLQR